MRGRERKGEKGTRGGEEESVRATKERDERTR